MTGFLATILSEPTAIAIAAAAGALAIATLSRPGGRTPKTRRSNRDVDDLLAAAELRIAALERRIANGQGSGPPQRGPGDDSAAVDFKLRLTKSEVEAADADPPSSVRDPNFEFRNSPPGKSDNQNAGFLARREVGRYGDDRRSADVELFAQPAWAKAIEPEVMAIFRLADRGKSAMAIATAVGRPIGEIELLIGLRRAASTRKT